MIQSSRVELNYSSRSRSVAPKGHQPFTPGDGAYIGAVFESVTESLGYGSLHVFAQNKLHRDDIPSLMALQSCPQPYGTRLVRLKTPAS
jgi:hypothetical protein